MRPFLTALVCLLLTAPLAAQQQKREPLTEKQQDQIAEAGIDPVARVNLYVKFLNEESDTVKGLIPRAKSSARLRRIDGELQDFAALMDELGDNLDVYSAAQGRYSQVAQRAQRVHRALAAGAARSA